MTHPTFSDEDKQFLRAILANPAELTAWLAYADWLDEHNERARSEFIRLEVRLTTPAMAQNERHGIAARLEELRPALDPNWVAVFDRPRIENCAAAFAFKCPKKWEQLASTDDPNVRHCPTCKKDVHYCHSLSEANGHARRSRCVAVATGVDRFPGDLERNPMRPSIGAGTNTTRVMLGLLIPPEPARPEPVPPKRPWWKFW